MNILKRNFNRYVAGRIYHFYICSYIPQEKYVFRIAISLRIRAIIYKCRFLAVRPEIYLQCTVRSTWDEAGPRMFAQASEHVAREMLLEEGGRKNLSKRAESGSECVTGNFDRWRLYLSRIAGLSGMIYERRVATHQRLSRKHLMTNYSNFAR